MRRTREAARSSSGVLTCGARRETEPSTSTLGNRPAVAIRAVEDDVAVEQAADGVGDGLVVVVAVDEDGVDAGDRPGGQRPGALEQAGQHREHRRREAAGGGRLPALTARPRAGRWRRG